jgi:hypothetical protein
MAEPTYTVTALDRSTWPAFAALVETDGGIFGGCWCIGFHPEGGDRSATPALNRERKWERVCAGTAHAALVFDGDDCVGWCQYGRPDEVPRIKNRAAYDKGRTTEPDWRLFHGALSTYEKVGFARERKLGKHRWVVTIDVPPS